MDPSLVLAFGSVGLSAVAGFLLSREWYAHSLSTAVPLSAALAPGLCLTCSGRAAVKRPSAGIYAMALPLCALPLRRFCR